MKKKQKKKRVHYPIPLMDTSSSKKKMLSGLMLRSCKWAIVLVSVAAAVAVAVPQVNTIDIIKLIPDSWQRKNLKGDLLLGPPTIIRKYQCSSLSLAHTTRLDSKSEETQVRNIMKMKMSIAWK